MKTEVLADADSVARAAGKSRGFEETTRFVVFASLATSEQGRSHGNKI
jgi:hypothetical protein